MHPILAGGRRVLPYMAAWIPVALLLVPLFSLAAPLAWKEAAALALPLALVYSFVCLGAYWVVRATPLHVSRLPQALLTRFGAAAVSASIWLVQARGFTLVLQAAGVTPGLAARQAALAPVLFGIGLLLFLLATAAYDLFEAVGASRRAERQALRFEVASREAELRALRAQVHPHFLFNSLNSINALIGARPEEARQLCVRLADFLRRSLTVGSRETISLAEELDLAEQLFSIEKVRFGDRLSHVIVADDAARGCRVPPLVLQPLVENAVTHGVAQTLEGGEIRVEAERRGAELRIAVVNPRDPDAPRKRGTGIGLQNVRRRLFTLHGEAAEVRVLPGDATFRVELRLPSGS